MKGSLSLEYRTKLAQAKEEVGEVKGAIYICSLNHIERERRVYHNIRVMEDRIKGGLTSKMTITTDDRISKEYFKKPLWSK